MNKKKSPRCRGFSNVQLRALLTLDNFQSNTLLVTPSIAFRLAAWRSSDPLYHASGFKPSDFSKIS
ncbi:MAG: hypothetical protein L0G42_10660, partial [Acinetobacter sp.]|nr:hypothetical protein [Acinetobacter sp.]